MNSLTHSNEHFLLTIYRPAKGPSHTASSLIRLSVPAPALYQLGLDEGEEFRFKGGNPRQEVHGFIMRPPGFDGLKSTSTFPLAFLIHGGPQGAWTDSWSTRWYVSDIFLVVVISDNLTQESQWWVYTITRPTLLC